MLKYWNGTFFACKPLNTHVMVLGVKGLSIPSPTVSRSTRRHGGLACMALQHGRDMLDGVVPQQYNVLIWGGFAGSSRRRSKNMGLNLPASTIRSLERLGSVDLKLCDQLGSLDLSLCLYDFLFV